MSITGRWRRDPGRWEAESVVVVLGRRFRFLATWGPFPGSHIGIWRTRTCALYGWNFRAGKRYVGPGITLLMHTRRADR